MGAFAPRESSTWANSCNSRIWSVHHENFTHGVSAVSFICKDTRLTYTCVTYPSSREKFINFLRWSVLCDDSSKHSSRPIRVGWLVVHEPNFGLDETDLVPINPYLQVIRGVGSPIYTYIYIMYKQEKLCFYLFSRGGRNHPDCSESLKVKLPI